MLTGTRLHGGTANSARGAESFVAEAITTAHAAGATGLLIDRMDSAFYSGAPIAACRRAGVRQRLPLGGAGSRTVRHGGLPRIGGVRNRAGEARRRA